MIRIHLVTAALLGGLALQSGAAAAADPKAGQKLFSVQCSACHSPTAGENSVGPSLFGVVGRKSGSIPNFH